MEAISKKTSSFDKDWGICLFDFYFDFFNTKYVKRKSAVNNYKFDLFLLNCATQLKN